MKKLLVLLFAILLVAGCSNDSADKDKDKTKEPNEEASEPIEEEKGKVYPMNEPVKITVVEYDLPFEITVNSFKMSKEFNGKPMSELFEHDFSRAILAIANVTIKNVSDQVFVPSEKTSPNLNFDGQITPPEDLSPKLDKKLEPGEEVSEDLVFLSYPDTDRFLLTYGFGTKNETEIALSTQDK